MRHSHHKYLLNVYDCRLYIFLSKELRITFLHSSKKKKNKKDLPRDHQRCAAHAVPSSVGRGGGGGFPVSDLVGGGGPPSPRFRSGGGRSPSPLVPGPGAASSPRSGGGLVPGLGGGGGLSSPRSEPPPCGQTN